MVVDFVLLSFQVKGHFKDVSAATVYDVLHDPIYRKLWDNNMLESYEVCCLNPMNDIGYYACKYFFEGGVFWVSIGEPKCSNVMNILFI